MVAAGGATSSSSTTSRRLASSAPRSRSRVIFRSSVTCGAVSPVSRPIPRCRALAEPHSRPPFQSSSLLRVARSSSRRMVFSRTRTRPRMRDPPVSPLRARRMPLTLTRDHLPLHPHQNAAPRTSRAIFQCLPHMLRSPPPRNCPPTSNSARMTSFPFPCLHRLLQTSTLGRYRRLQPHIILRPSLSS